MVKPMPPNPYDLDKLSLQSLKGLFPAIFYLDQTALAGNLTASLLVEELELAGGEFTGEAAFWLKILSTPTEPETQLRKIQFKRNVYNAYNHFVEPLLQTNSTCPGPDVSIGTSGAAVSKAAAADEAEESFPRQPQGHFASSSSHLTAVAPDELVTQSADDSALADAYLLQEALDAMESTSSVVATPLSPKRRKPTVRDPIVHPQLFNSVQQQSAGPSRDSDSSQLANIFKCKLCPATFASRAKLASHKYTEHADVFCHACDVSGCSYRSQYSWDLKNHAKARHSNKKSYQCESCDKAFKTGTLLIRHRSDEHLKKVRKCDQCDFVCKFSEWTKLNQHKYSVHGVPLQNACKLCSFSAHSKAELSHHINKAHVHSNKHFCSDCTFSTFSLDALLSHRRECNQHNQFSRASAANRVTAFWCSECGHNFRFEQFANSHVAKAHLPKVATAVPTNSSKTGTLTFKCSCCDFSSVFKYELDSHLRDNHDGLGQLVAEYAENDDYVAPVIQCPHCPFSTATRAAISSHIRARHERVIRKCHLCDYKTFHKNALSGHLFYKHGAPKKRPPKPSRTQMLSSSQLQTSISNVPSTSAVLSSDASLEETSLSSLPEEVITSPNTLQD